MYTQYSGSGNGYGMPWQIELTNKLRELWFEHVMWSRAFIMSAINDSKDLDAVTQRLLRNPADFAAFLRPIYGVQKAAVFEGLLRDHLLIAGAFVNATKAGDQQEAEKQKKKWYANADDIAAFLHEINPYWNEKVWKELLYDHLGMLEDEATAIMESQYEKSIDIFDQIQAEAMKMADYMAYGILKQTRL
ncbi:MAG: acetylglutamate kinase [Clostridiaceae bacterium]|nr:acetylglutamate kinase [Eubacteriales bacterium]